MVVTRHFRPGRIQWRAAYLTSLVYFSSRGILSHPGAKIQFIERKFLART